MPLHVRWLIRPAELERYDVIDDVAGAWSDVAPAEGQGCSRWKSRLAVEWRQMRPWLSRSHDGQVT